MQPKTNSNCSLQRNRREFIRDSALAAAGLAMGVQALAEESSVRKALNYNENMGYRPCGKTGLLISNVCMGGHWKRLDMVVPGVFKTAGLFDLNINNDPEFAKNRYAVVSRCIEKGINYIDACVGAEVVAYAKALKGRRSQMYLGYSWYEKEARNAEWRSAKKLLQSFDEGLQEAKLDYVDLWRITCHEQGGDHSFNESAEIAEALDTAKRQGKARFTGVSSHDRRWLKMMIEEFPGQMEIVVTPYTAKSKVAPTDSLFDAVKQHQVGVFGIKPFANNSLFKGNSAPDSPEAEEDSRRARLAIRNILANPAITAPIPGLISAEQVDNVAMAAKESRELDRAEARELEMANNESWSKLTPDYQWLKNWEYV
jgi:aryl-alcohol dehydrogenase-like predicted oxidoreductase